MKRFSTDPLEARSRYLETPGAPLLAVGRAVRWRMPRILPPLEEVPKTGRAASMRAGERLDQLAFRVLGDPLADWLLTDANSSLDPLRFLSENAYGVELPSPRVPR